MQLTLNKGCGVGTLALFFIRSSRIAIEYMILNRIVGEVSDTGEQRHEAGGLALINLVNTPQLIQLNN